MKLRQIIENNEYEGLEDADEFGNIFITTFLIDEDFIQLFSQYHEGQTDPLYAAVSRAYIALSHHQEWTGERPADDNEWPKVLTIDEAEYDAIIDVATKIYVNPQNPKEHRIVRKYLRLLDMDEWLRDHGDLQITDEFGTRL